ncbi:hypothetical protein L1049_007905 [Liquidambar formosana]|uniref:Uncharacterized protein n=1 Tax=Liquidambar formosana TaxID=63359 RepID=A0AAP0S263_LIQFO
MFTSKGSCVWGGIKKGFVTFQKGTKWNVKNGHQINFWSDKWNGQGVIRNCIEGPLNVGEDTTKICDLINEDGEWKFDGLSFVLPPTILDLIGPLPTLHFANGDDCISWSESKSGKFCSKSAYNLANNSPGCDSPNPIWTKIWNINTLPKIQNFLWLCCQKKIACNEVLFKRHITFSNLCPICFNEPKTVEHVLRDCEYAREFWAIVHPNTLSTSGLTLDAWILHNVSGQIRDLDRQIPHSIIFPFACWALWHNRNKFVFEQNMLVPKDNCEAMLINATEYFYISRKFKSPSQSRRIMVKWEPLTNPFYKLNTDGSSLGNPGKASAGGLIRDHLGQWIEGYSRKLGTLTSTAAEIWGLHDGLELALKCNIMKLYVDMDASAAISLLQSEISPAHPWSSVIFDCRWRMDRFE